MSMTVKTALAALLSTVALGQAQAVTITGYIYLNNQTLAENATIAGRPATPADAVFTSGAIDFRSSESSTGTIGDFLNNPASLDPTVAAATLNNTYFYFTGQTFLNAGDNTFVVPHDDGLQLDVLGIAGLEVDAPGPTGEVNTPFTVTAPSAGLYDFILSYGECCQGPARLAFIVNDQPVTGDVPEPASFALLGMGLVAAAAAMRRR